VGDDQSRRCLRQCVAKRRVIRVVGEHEGHGADLHRAQDRRDKGRRGRQRDQHKIARADTGPLQHVAGPIGDRSQVVERVALVAEAQRVAVTARVGHVAVDREAGEIRKSGIGSMHHALRQDRGMTP
jgi:hypothetical protein